MHSRLLVSGLPRSLPSLPRSPALPCLLCVKGRQRAAPHSSEFPPTTAPLQTLHMDVWGPAPVGGTDQECYFLLVVDDYTCYTNVFPSQRKVDVSDEGIRQSFTLPASPQQNGIAERRIGLIMETGKVGDASVFWVWGALSLVRDAKASKLSSCTLRRVFLGFPTDAPPWQFYHPRERRVFSSQDVTFDESVCFYRLHLHASHPGPALLGVSQVDPPPLVEPLEISSDSSSPSEGGDPAADDTVATRRSPRLENPPGLPPQPSSPPPQPAAVDSGAETAGAELGGAERASEGSGGATTGGAGSGGTATGGADFGGAASPSGGGAVGDPSGGPGAGQPPHPDILETLSPQAIHVWIFRRGSPGGGGYGPAGAGAVSPGGTAGARGAGGTDGGAAGAGGTRGDAGVGGTGAASLGGTRGAAGAGVAGATILGGATGAGGAGGASPGGPAGAGGAGAAGTGGAGAAGVGGAEGAAGAGGTGAGGTGGAGAAGPGGARTGGAGAAGAGGAVGAEGARGAAGGTGAAGTGCGGATGAGAAQGQPRDSAMAPVQPSLGPSRDEPRVFGLENTTLADLPADRFGGVASFSSSSVRDNKAMLALCHEQRLEHRTKHIALRYFLARELHQRGQFCLSYMASRPNTIDVFTKTLGSGDLQRFRTTLGLLHVLPLLLVS
ncbi:unnamed protein product [Closterium sp. NIES-54]